MCTIGPTAWILFREVASKPLSQSFVQIFAAILICVALKKHPTATTSGASWLGLSVAAIFSACIGLAQGLHLNVLNYTFVIAFVFSLYWALQGTSRFVSMLPVLAMAFFLVPEMPEDIRLKISLPLQMLSTKGCVALSSLFIPISSVGHTFNINGQLFDVEPGCSGLNLWITLLFGFAAWQLFQRFKFIAYPVMLALIPIVTLALNAVRLFITALVAFHYGTKIALSVHTNLEAVLLPLGLYALYRVGGLFRAPK
ncbi:MAG: archaeosortase/exosortase family protein [Terriglobales bacterium]